MPRFPSPRLRLLIAALAAPVALPLISFSQTTGFNQTGAGPFNYNDPANWVGGAINGIWDPSLSVTAGQVVEFGADTTLSTGLSFRESPSQNKTLRATGGPFTLTLGGDIRVQTSGNNTITFGSTSGSQNLHIDLGGAVRTLTVIGGGNGGNFGRTLTFVNNVSNGGIIASGGGSGGGKIQFNALAISLDSAEVRDAELSFNGSGNSSANSIYTIAGTLTGGGGASTVTVHAKTSATARHALVQADSFTRAAGSTVLFRGTALGTETIASATDGTANISFTNAPTLLGGGGAAGTSTIGIIAGAFGDTSTTGTGFGATGGLVTYDAANGVRLLSASEYASSIADGQTALDNVRIANSSGAIATTHLTAATTTINSLSLAVSGATGNQGITITGDPGATLKINSGVIYAEQNVTLSSGSPATTDAMTINAPTLDLNGQEGIILVNTRFNSGGTAVSNGALIINSTITNGTGLTIGDGLSNSPSGYVIIGGDSANTYTGDTTINGAIVQLNKTVANSFGDLVLNLGSVYNRGNQIDDTANVTINGGTFFLNSTNNSGSATSETINDLTMRYGAVSSGSGSGNTFNIDGDALLSGGTINMPTNAKLNIAGTTTLSGGVISVGANNSSSTSNSKATLAGAVIIENTEPGTATYNAINIAAGSGSGNLGGQVELSGDVTFIGNANTNTVTITGATGTGQQGVVALNGTRTFDIGDGAADSDLTINAPLTDGTAAGGLVKTGAGTLALLGDNTYTGPTTISAGTLSLVAAHRLADTGQLVMNGGVFATNGFSETLGTLALAASSTIDLGDGDSDLAFADSSGIAWGESLVLNIINFTEGVDSIRFGLDQDGLDATQLGMIRLNGSAASIDSAGFLTFGIIPEPSAYAALAGTASLLLALRRRRRAA